ncbi:unnamed protein product [Brachionus calyciflorus]|uniref:Uncharacterized protein n=1 Tax=Brachionus calyciflorus TaxID=104777 RepID=A0A813ZAC7_9BILA|nr:unnamed protein product [Brachionus calyciflorus]
MNKNWLKDNSNFSPSIRKLRNRRILDEKPTSNIQSNFVEKNSNQEESDVNTDVYIDQNCHGFSLMQNFSENVGESSNSSSSSSCDESSDSDVSIISTDSEQFDEVEEFYCELGGLKLCSLCYYYTKERLVKNSNKYQQNRAMVVLTQLDLKDQYWYLVRNARSAVDILPQMIKLSEAYIQIWEKRIESNYANNPSQIEN